MASGFTPPSMNWEATDITDEFARFKQYCNLVFDGPYSKKSAIEKSSYILLWIGRQGVDIYNSFVWDNEDDKTKLEPIWSKFEKHLAPRTNYRLARYQLQQLKQTSDENIDDFMTRCRNQANKCKFRDQRETNERLVEQLIIGTKHKKAQEFRILGNDEDLTLDKAIDYARTYEATLQHVEQLHNNEIQSVHAIGKTWNRKCGNCGNQHEQKKCSAYGSQCHFCSRYNHWSKMCRQKANNGDNPNHTENASAKRVQANKPRPFTQDTRRNRRVHEMHADNELSDQFDTLHFESITVGSITPDEKKDEAFATIDISIPSLGNSRAQLKAKLDTGAQENILPMRIYQHMFPQNVGNDGQPKPSALTTSSTILTAYGGSMIKQFGTCEIECKHNEIATTALFYVTDAPGRAIIGLPTALELNLVTLNCSVEQQNEVTQQQQRNNTGSKEQLLEKYPHCFDGVGKFQGEYHITLDPNVAPVIHPPRRVPISLKDDIKRELDDMITRDIIAKVREGEPTS
ncbi:hypothetical protein QZH41_006864 [Actinostola sp. cb2023]|nr:hypothetical protein QZH41_006864 [Actinostola sp. cb2023]